MAAVLLTGGVSTATAGCIGDVVAPLALSLSHKIPAPASTITIRAMMGPLDFIVRIA